MPHVSFATIQRGTHWTRNDLAALWGYAAYNALARGVVTPKGDNKIVLFVTENKPADRTQYHDKLEGSVLRWEGPTDRFAEDRMLGVPGNGDEIHVFYRLEPKHPFTYLGQYHVAGGSRRTATPSSFELRLL